MKIRLETGEWIINDEYFITNGLNGYEVYTCGSEDSEAKNKEIKCSENNVPKNVVHNFKCRKLYDN